MIEEGIARAPRRGALSRGKAPDPSEPTAVAGVREDAIDPDVAQGSRSEAGIAVPAPLPHHCGRCPARWGGLLTAHCTACHQTFSRVSSFDKHRGGDHGGGTRHCLDPAAVGLVRNAAGRWSLGGDNPHTAKTHRGSDDH